MIARVLVAALWLATVGGSAAQPARTALVLVPAENDALSAEISARLSGELAAEGFAVTRRASPANLSPQPAVESAQADASAVLLIAPATDAPLAIWLSDRLAGHTSMARLQVEQETLTPSQLTVRAVELLRARLSERAVSADREDGWQLVPVREVVVAPEAPASKVEEPLELAVGVGAGMLAGTRWLPVVSLAIGVPIARKLALDLGLSGGAFSTRERAGRAEGSAAIGQAFASGVAALRFRTWSEPSVRIAAGAHMLLVEGRAQAPFRARDVISTSPFFSAGLGVRSPAWWHLRVALSADLLLLTRPGVVLVAMQEVARAARASALLRAELVATF